MAAGLARRDATRLSPSTATVALHDKATEGVALWRAHRQNAGDFEDMLVIFDGFREYDEMLARHSGVSLADARVFEVGFGARPYRLAALHSMGVDARGVDAETPIVSGSPREFLDVYRTNGAERTAKSLVRHVVFDRRERRRLHDELRRRGHAYRLDRRAMTIGNAAAVDLEAASIDLVYSEDVFEHIDRASLAILLERMARWLSPAGIAMIRPNVWTGITGGHLVEWNRRSFRQPPRRRVTQPWQHLSGTTSPNTYLNRLTRQDYRDLFERDFDILEERVRLPGLGAEHLTGPIAQRLAEWPHEELFSNQVLFVLRARPR